MDLRLIAISDRRRLVGEDLVGWAVRVAAAGVPTLQLRDRDLPDRARFELASAMVASLLDSGATLVVNGRPDIALAAGAAGVHLPADEIAVEAARRIGGSAVAVGRSTHDLDEVRRARDEGATYVTFGPVFPTASKPGLPGVGLEELAAAARLGIPVVALGGIVPERLAAVAAAGAVGGAAIGAFADPGTTAAMVAAAREAFR